MFRRLETYQVVSDLLLAVAYLVVAASYDLSMRAGPGPPTVAVTVIFAVALVLRRWSPALALGIAWVAAIVQMIGLLTPGLADTAVFAVLYVTAAYGTRPVFWLGLGSAMVGSVVAAAYLFLAPLGEFALDWSADRFTVVLVMLLLALLLSWTVGALVRTSFRARENRLAQVRAEAAAAAEAERVRVVRDVHDVVAHSLAVVIAQADGARYSAAGDPGATGAALTTIGSTARSALADIRLLLTQLRHSQAEGPQPTLADVEELYAQVRSAGVDLRVDVDPAPVADPTTRSSAAVQLAVYRILQEALTNALRHGDGGPVDVRLGWHPDRVELTVLNRAGRPTSFPPVVGHGLIGMRERAQLVGGTLEAGVRDGGFRVDARLPIGGPT